jgi:hypothetical protein
MGQRGVIHAKTSKSSMGSWRLARARVKVFNSSFVAHGLFILRFKPCSTENFCYGHETTMLNGKIPFNQILSDMKISIREFIDTGSFGPLKLGATKQQTLSLFGKPNDDADLGATGSILLYAWYELFFNHEDILHSIQIDNYDPNDKESYYFKNKKIEIDSWFLNEVCNQNLESVSKILDQADITYEKIDYYGREALKAQSGVVVDFQDEENYSGVKELIGLRYWP